ncbi:MAG: hypothetical protein A3B74_01685 [Candidatus Kerfeldbacteria bacterium RIFCSPHIGHO2_02_FULL_42_14]|uniref:Peptidase M56 domain-containing protein n=1 Tax=Candidatus Kerfeldbacteria bacterium RIFCSPHIGHO2_02_FULL_42_14 TaxID=1798540 RepID=A0A1G2AUT4_9BACT|nr:MAG: hypothetical protein A3B74_01685 [Candidatus Kerfeldbacteria bacterium RIFCSPHIGHO2_02_FULL_42_14]OGY82225.1 MAG: hypothetical protein A3E60_00015 [Candidatus Kerfeldbacteria bacterium RIFCSPHIGHO2_12_FULL_42_13]OGY82700.1 MAG: hypothetical protein A3I91_00905 [Candidatus Kerfeldbacteria bacterium RIFCSPLOWO2_02_FULL_42_19]OGY87798.1 MAG: hypothetical protein A3G01_05110 [Candidatus Kerfeldbacteria bacterium RIFCSPLOWO2_12_FULL_43_9]
MKTHLMENKNHDSCIHLYSIFFGIAVAMILVGVLLYMYEMKPIFTLNNWCAKILGRDFSHNPWHSVALLFISTWIFIAVFLQIKLWCRTRTVQKFWSQIQQIPKKKMLLDLIEKLQIPAQRIIILKDQNAFALTKGFFYTKIFISEKLIEMLTNDELSCVLHHEYYHLRHRDPLRIACMQSVSNFCFFIPIMQEIMQRYLLHQEFAADAEVLRRYDRRILLSAIMKIMKHTKLANTPKAIGGPVYGLALFSPMKVRLHYILNQIESKRNCTHFSLRKILFSVTCSMIIIVAFVIVMLPKYTDATHENTMCYELFQKAPNMSRPLQSVAPQ